MRSAVTRRTYAYMRRPTRKSRLHARTVSIFRKCKSSTTTRLRGFNTQHATCLLTATIGRATEHRVRASSTRPPAPCTDRSRERGYPPSKPSECSRCHSWLHAHRHTRNSHHHHVLSSRTTYHRAPVAGTVIRLIHRPAPLMHFPHSIPARRIRRQSRKTPMKKLGIASHVATRNSQPKTSLNTGVNAVSYGITDALAIGKTVAVTCFVMLSTPARPVRQGRNPCIGAGIAFCASTAPAFRVAKTLHDTVNQRRRTISIL